MAHKVCFEEVAYLLWFGRLPNRDELDALKAQFHSYRHLPEVVQAVLHSLPPATAPLEMLRTVVSAWGTETSGGRPTLEQALALTASFPIILASFQRVRQGLAPLESRPDLGQAANYLYLLSGQIPEERHSQALDAYLVLLAEHGMNASTFTARVVASTESDLVSAVVAAIGALKGPLHGGAPSKVIDMLAAIGSTERVESWVSGAFARGERLMGFGHRVYKTEDPRAEELRELARLADPQRFSFARRVEEVALRLLEVNKPGRRLYTNVEYYSAVLLASLGLPGDLFTPTFAVGRIAGWTAHILEQAANNRLIRPEAEYTGPEELHVVPLAERS